ncbi:MAG: clostripain-related cysteine peptidase [Chloroflexi bacterium]|nr:clostripain-related cysteine peptidase [Chloroflexota bacterium]
MKKPIVYPLLFIVTFMLVVGLACGTSKEIATTKTVEPQATLLETEGAVPLDAPGVSDLEAQTQTWLILFYFDADDIVLEEDIMFDLNEVEMVGSSDRVKMVAQIDRNEEAYTGDGNWSTARRYYLTKDDDLNKINSEMIADLGEVDMGNTATLIDFATWAIQSYPADRVVLIMSDHGSGWPGGWSDSNPLDENANWIYLNDLENALGQIITNTGIGQFELVGMDACLMSMLEVYNGLAPYSRYVVASQELEPGLGWAYNSFLSDLVAQPEMNGADLGRKIVESYVVEDQRILNDEARKNLLASYGYVEPKSAGETVQEMGTTVTLAAVDSSALPNLNASLDNFLYALKNVDQTKVAEARSYAQTFKNVFGTNYPAPYIDLSNFADFVVKTTGDQAVIQSAEKLQTAISNAVISEKHGEQRPGARGISVFFPVSELYWSEDFGVAYYVEATRSSSSQTLWDDFLAFHYAGQEFGLGTPPQEVQPPAPGAAQVTIAPLTLSQEIMAPGGSINIQTDISGEQVAYIYLVGLIRNNNTGQYLAYFIDYLQMDENSQELSGVSYPVWSQPNGLIHISVDWNLTANAVCDDENCVFALVNPDKYTPQPEKRLYYVEGWYVYADTGQKIEAAMYFYNEGGNLIRHIVANPVGNASLEVPSDLVPRVGDQFMTMNTVLTFDESGQFSGEYQEGNSLTFGDKPFYYATFDEADPADYRVGIMVRDMDGNKTWQFAPVTVDPNAAGVAPEPSTGQESQPVETVVSGSFGETWQSPQAKTIRSPFIPIVGGLIGAFLAFLIVQGASRKATLVAPRLIPNYSPPAASYPQSAQTPPRLVTSPPPLQTNPPPISGNPTSSEFEPPPG